MSRLRETITFLFFAGPVFIISALLGMSVMTLEPVFSYFHEARGNVEPDFYGIFDGCWGLRSSVHVLREFDPDLALGRLAYL
jgi:hypothetical protein